MNEIELNDGKYKVIFQEEPFIFKAFEHGEEWRDLSGDKLIYCMMQEILELRDKIHTWELGSRGFF